MTDSEETGVTDIEMEIVTLQSKVEDLEKTGKLATITSKEHKKLVDKIEELMVDLKNYEESVEKPIEFGSLLADIDTTEEFTSELFDKRNKRLDEINSIINSKELRFDKLVSLYLEGSALTDWCCRYLENSKLNIKNA